MKRRSFLTATLVSATLSAFAAAPAATAQEAGFHFPLIGSKPPASSRSASA